MMSDVVGRYRRAYPRIFRHPEFKKLPPLGQRLALYVLLGPQSNRIGLFYFSPNTAAEDLDTTPETLRKALSEVCSTFGWMFDADARVFYIATWWKWNAPDHGKVLIGNLKDLSEIPPCGLVDAFAANLTYLNPELHETFLEAICKRLPKGPRSQEQYQESVSGKQNRESTAPKVTRPTEKANDNEVHQRQLTKIARQVVRQSGPGAALDYLTDAVTDLARHEKVPTSAATVHQALANALGVGKEPVMAGGACQQG